MAQDALNRWWWPALMMFTGTVLCFCGNKKRKAEQNTQVNNQAMMLTNPEQFTLAPIPYDMGLGFGEYGNAVGQSLLTYAQK